MVHSVQLEEFLMTFASFGDNQLLPDDLTAMLFQLPAHFETDSSEVALPPVLIDALVDRGSELIDRVQEKAAKLLDTEAEKLSRWADDEKLALRLEIERLDEEINDLQRQVRQVQTLEEKLTLRRQERDLDRTRTEKRRALYEAQDRVDAERERLLDAMQLAIDGELDGARIWLGNWRLEG